ncbi:hypothetical protein [Pseudomonas sp. LRF_L74]|uniref:hypothetical protein n=1 Tax=Pseudomonas sp. LRF_L74 TaxID=3369422 RepID=UPI003F63CEC6
MGISSCDCYGVACECAVGNGHGYETSYDQVKKQVDFLLKVNFYKKNILAVQRFAKGLA